MFGGGQSESDNNAAENNGATQFFSNLQSGFKPAIRFFMILLGIGAILLIIYWFRLFGLRLMKKQKAIQAGDYSYLIGEEYTKTKQYLSKIHPEDTLHYPKDMASFLRNCGDPDIASKAEEMIQKAEKNCYSPDAINANEAHELINYFKLIRTNLKSEKK